MKSAENKAESVREVFTIGYVVFKYFKKIQQCLRFETHTHAQSQWQWSCECLLLSFHFSPCANAFACASVATCQTTRSII